MTNHLISEAAVESAANAILQGVHGEATIQELAELALEAALPYLEAETADVNLTPEQVVALTFHPDIDPALVALVRGQAEKLANFEADGQRTFVHVHHHDIESHARSFNEGYAAAVAHMADT